MKLWDWITQKDLDREMARQFDEAHRRLTLTAERKAGENYNSILELNATDTPSCKRCGAVVADTEQHDEWHRWLWDHLGMT